MCGRTEKFNVFDLACGFLNNSLKALAHILPTSGDYELWQSMILELCAGPALPRHKRVSICENNALCHFLVIPFFFPHSSFLTQCSRGEDPLDIQLADSVPRLSMWSLLFKIYEQQV